MSIFKGAAVAIITPMTETQEVNYEKLGELIEEQIAGGTDAIYINDRVRRLTPNEVRRILGFPEGFSFPVSENHAYEQLGNSVAVPVLKLIAEQIVSTGVFDEDSADSETVA